MAKMLEKAKSIGLGNPEGIITNKLDAVRVMAHGHANRVAKMIKNRKEQLSRGRGLGEESEIEEGEDAVTLDEEPNAGPSRPVRWSMTQRIRRADDEDDEEEDFGRFEYGEDGRLV